MRFYVPQFIDVEDKIFGPLTFKQFVYLIGGAALSFIAWYFLPAIFSWPLMAVIIAFSLALAFYKVNDKPFIHTVEAGAKYLMKTKLYIWKKQPKPESKRTRGKEPLPGDLTPQLSSGKLKDISWSLGVKESMYQDNQNTKENKLGSAQDVEHYVISNLDT